MSKKKEKHLSKKTDNESINNFSTYGYIAIRFVNDSFCFFIDAFAEIIDDDCCVYSKDIGHHKFPKSMVESIHGDNLLIWKNNSLNIKGNTNDEKRSSS